ncbi:adenosine receptor A2b [Hydra vulgaris]|uniref:adenosine receptor A2b n=1 Tax=Hydra vulgaris TaxID=6087 RepID=UPI0006415808|nr:adenosine receptor A2b [Hydra vulgaris]
MNVSINDSNIYTGNMTTIDSKICKMNISATNSINDTLELHLSTCTIEFKAAFHIPALVLAFLIIFANSLVIYLFLKNRTLRKTVANILLISLSVTDLVSGISMFIHIMPYYYTLFKDCSTVHHVFDLAYFASSDIITNGLTITSVLHLLLLSSERFVLLYYALRCTVIVTRKRLIVLSFTAWVVGAFVTLIQLIWVVPYISEPNNHTRLAVLHNDKIYTVTTIALFSFIPIFVLLFQYIWLFSLIRRLSKKNPGIQSKKVWSRELKGVIVNCIMFVSFVLFCFPYLLVKCFICLDHPVISELPSEFFETFFLLRYIISIINPLIYALYKKDFRRTIPITFLSLSKTFLMTSRPTFDQLSSRPTLSRSGEKISFIEIGTRNSKEIKF